MKLSILYEGWLDDGIGDDFDVKYPQKPEIPHEKGRSELNADRLFNVENEGMEDDEESLLDIKWKGEEENEDKKFLKDLNYGESIFINNHHSDLIIYNDELYINKTTIGSIARNDDFSICVTCIEKDNVFSVNSRQIIKEIVERKSTKSFRLIGSNYYKLIQQ